MQQKAADKLKLIKSRHMTKIYLAGSTLYLAAICLVIYALYLFYLVGGTPLFMAVLIMSLSNMIARKTRSWVDHKERIATVSLAILLAAEEEAREKENN